MIDLDALALDEPLECFTHFWIRHIISRPNEPFEFEIYCQDCGIKAESGDEEE